MKVNVNGKEVEGKIAEFSTIGEPWAEYQLEGGKRARVKFVLTRLIETNERGPDGMRIYQFNGQPILAVDDELDSGQPNKPN